MSHSTALRISFAISETYVLTHTHASTNGNSGIDTPPSSRASFLPLVRESLAANRQGRGAFTHSLT